MKLIILHTDEYYVADRFDTEARAKMLFEALLNDKQYSGSNLLNLVLLAQEQVTVIRVLLQARRTKQKPSDAYQYLVDETNRRAAKLGLSETLDLHFIESKECEEIICNNILDTLSYVKSVIIRNEPYKIELISNSFPRTSKINFSQADDITYYKKEIK